VYNKTFIMSFRDRDRDRGESSNSNKIPLGKPASISSKPSSGSSLLNPSYLRGGGDSNSSDDYESFQSYFHNFSSASTASAVSSAVANITSSLKRNINKSDDECGEFEIVYIICLCV